MPRPARHGKAELADFLRTVAKAYPRRRLHVVLVDHHPQAAEIDAWPAKNPRVHLHLTPPSGSWLNLVAVFFGIITRQAIRRGSFETRHRAHRHDPRLHRRLERSLPPLHLDQDRRRDPAPRHP